MAEPIEISDDWPPDYVDWAVRVRLDGELARALLGDQLEYAHARSRMPRQVRIREDRVAARPEVDE